MDRPPRSTAVALLFLVSLVAGAACALPGTSSTSGAATAPAATATPSPQPTNTAVPSPQPPRDLTTQEIYRRVGPAVVTVLTRFSQGGQRGTSFGTGVIVNARGYVVTNNHVIEGQQQLKVIFQNGAEREAQLVGADPLTDLAVLKVEGDLPATASLGDSAKLEPGQPVVAIGSALGEFTNTVTTGIISGLYRQLPRRNAEPLEGLIQTDAAINPGNSGGPLLNLQGQVIGINTAVVRQTGQGSNLAEGLGFAVPANLVKAVSDQIVAEGRVIRPNPGVTTTPVTPGLAAERDLPVQQGAFVQQVDRGGPAEAAGVQQNDVIVALDGKQVNEQTSLNFLLLGYRPGTQVTVILARGQERISVRVTLGE